MSSIRGLNITKEIKANLLECTYPQKLSSSILSLFQQLGEHQSLSIFYYPRMYEGFEGVFNW